MSSARAPNSMVCDTRRSTQISEQAAKEHVVRFDSTQTTPVDTTWVSQDLSWQHDNVSHTFDLSELFSALPPSKLTPS